MSRARQRYNGWALRRLPDTFTNIVIYSYQCYVLSKGGHHGDHDHFSARSDEGLDRGPDQARRICSSSDYVRDLIRRDRQRRAVPEFTLDDLRRIVAEARAGGDTDESVRDIFAAAKATLAAMASRKGKPGDLNG